MLFCLLLQLTDLARQSLELALHATVVLLNICLVQSSERIAQHRHNIYIPWSERTAFVAFAFAFAADIVWA
jgi:hypothetical protein